MKLTINLFMLAVIIILGWVFWTPGSGYQPQVEQAGYTQVKMGTWSFFDCPKDEVGYNFTGVKDGKQTEGVICRTHYFWGSYQVRTL